MAKKGKIQKKILALLLAGFGLGLTRSARTQLRVIKELSSEWKKIDREALKEAITSLYRSNLISYRDNKNGTTTVILNKKGKELALTYNLEKMELKKSTKWDGRWRLIMFDIPEKLK